MPHKPFPFKYKILLALAACVLLMMLAYRAMIWEMVQHTYDLVTDREKSRAFISSFGTGAPVIFILFQILQVLFAPVPGEASGFIGGYIFGTFQGFLYSSIGLSVGSWINFSIGRLLGRHYVRKLIPGDKLERFDATLKHQGSIVVFILFIFPGFPKDYLCYFLGLSTFPLKVFILMASIGRMPGTFMLSLQGASLYDRSYGLFTITLILCLLFAFAGYRYREKIYQWIDRMNNG